MLSQQPVKKILRFRAAATATGGTVPLLLQRQGLLVLLHTLAINQAGHE